MKAKWITQSRSYGYKKNRNEQNPEEYNYSEEEALLLKKAEISLRGITHNSISNNVAAIVRDGKVLHPLLTESGDLKPASERKKYK